MEFKALIQLCMKLWADYNTLRAYFADDHMVGILQEVGETDFQAAVIALEAARHSNDPSREVAEAIGHLRAASVRCLVAANKRRFFGLLKATGHARYSAYGVVLKASLLTALCYRHLQDVPQAREHLLTARRYFDDYAEAELDAAWEDESASSAGIGMAAAVSDSFDVSSALDEQENRVDATRSNIEEEKKCLNEFIEMSSKADSSLPAVQSLGAAASL